MLLTITMTGADATDLGYLLHKHPARVQAFDLAFGRAHVFYPEARPDRCTAALLLEVDPVGLVRDRRGPVAAGRLLEQYVNDRPYVASSFMSVAIAQVFGTALSGRCEDRPHLLDKSLPLEAKLAVVAVRGGGADLIGELFAPLGYEVEAAHHPLDEAFDEWGSGPYYTLVLRGTLPLKELLRHLYVLIPVLDNDKHYWVGSDEVDKLLRRGEGWLRDHPLRGLITARYLRYLAPLTREALTRLTDEDQIDPDREAERHDRQEEEIERPLSLNQQRQAAVVAALKASGASRVLDLGCAQGSLLRALLDEPQFDHIAGLDVSLRALHRAGTRLRLDRLPERRRRRIKLLHGSLIYRDERLTGFDAAAVIEVIEHFDPPRLAAMERAVFEFARPRTVVVTTPNAEYNVRFESLPAGTLRHSDHRFEWTRDEFRGWAERVAARFGYAVRFLPIGDNDPDVGAPTQMGVFER